MTGGNPPPPPKKEKKNPKENKITGSEDEEHLQGGGAASLTRAQPLPHDPLHLHQSLAPAWRSLGLTGGREGAVAAAEPQNNSGNEAKTQIKVGRAATRRQSNIDASVRR